MRRLLDTHALLWHLRADPALSATARDAIQQPGAEVFVSVASLWEIAIKVALGKLELGITFAELHQRRLPRYGFKVLPITPEHLERLLTLPQTAHRDPFDRILVAQTFAEGMEIISDDPLLDLYGVPRLW